MFRIIKKLLKSKNKMSEATYYKLEELEMVIKNFDLAYETDLDDRVTDQEALKFRMLNLIEDITDSINESEEK